MAKSTNVVRKDVMGRKVVVTAVRGARPHDHPPERVKKTTPAEKCFFCPGNEHLTPPEIDRIEVDGKWEIRCFPNKFPAFCAESPKAYGRHDVIVETPDHQKTLSELTEENLFRYLLMVQKRMKEMYSDQRIKYVSVFKNEGKAAGASLEHSHTQLVSMEFVPDYIKKMGKKARRFRSFKKVSAKIMAAENEHFGAGCPRASRFHSEVWVLPKADTRSLLELDEGRLRSLASLLKQVLSAIDAINGYPPYNIVFHSAPAGEGDFPFHLEILPRTSVWAGFELGTEVVMLSELSEDTAKAIRERLQK